MKARLLICLLAALPACHAPAPPAPAGHSGASDTPSASASAAYSYADELATTTRAISEAAQQAARPGAVWTSFESLAERHLARAQLTGEYADYLDAGAALQAAFAHAAKGGPYLARARWNFAVHRLDAATADLDQARSARNADGVVITAMAADLAFYRGRYDEALAGYREALDQRDDMGNLVRLAIWHARMGHTAEAAALLDRADRQYHGNGTYPRAWLALQQGLLRLERGDWAAALSYYSSALRLLPGWWLAREHIAEVHALQGKHDEALREYEGIVADTGHPEFMDAIARIHLAQNHPDLAQPWIERAGKVYAQRFAELPEATYGHGLEHYLLYGSGAETLDLAKKNCALRPFGEARIRLVQAYLINKQPREAEKELRTLLASSWETAEMHTVAAQTYQMLGREEQSRAEREKAEARNPHAMTQYALPAGR